MFLPTAIRDGAVNLFDILGFQDVSKSENPRLLFLNHTLKLDRFLGKKKASSDEILDSDLSLIETTLQNIRESGDTFLSSIAEERESATKTCGDLKTHSLQSGLDNWYRLADQVAIEFHQQLIEEERTTREFLVSLDSFYVGPQQTNTLHSLVPYALLDLLEYLQLCLRRESFRNGHVLRRVNDLLISVSQSENLLRGKSTDLTDVPPRSSASCTRTIPVGYRPPNILDLVKIFLSPSDHGDSSPMSQFISALAVGDQGSGKSYICDAIEDLAFEQSTSISVFRPKIPIDFLGSTVGESEDRLLALFNAASQQGQTSILLLDDADLLLFPCVVEGTVASSPPNHQALRMRSTLMGLMDSMPLNASKVLFVCTAKSNFGGLFSRFDYVFHLHQPDLQERKDFVASGLGIHNNRTLFESQISSIAEDLVGRSFLEISQICGEAIKDAASPQEFRSAISTSHVVDAMQSCIHKKKPQSLRRGILRDFVDMSVYSGEDLGAHSTSTSFELGLYGTDIQNAWKEILSQVVIPLCRQGDVSKLVNEGQSSASAKIFCGGILLHGEAGTGKTSLAFAAARYASTLMPRVNLVDVACTSLIHKEVGGSEQAVIRLFASARQAAPCILLLDGIENIAATRGNDTTTEGSLDRVLSSLLVELDGVEDHNSSPQGGIAVIGITQNDEWIDPALRRAGRLSKSVALGLPEQEARHQIVQRELAMLLTNDKTMGIPEDIAAQLTAKTKGMTGAAVVAACKSIIHDCFQGIVSRQS